MKVKISLALIAIYLFSIVLTAPASVITHFIADSSGIRIGHISGSLWKGKLSQVDYRNQFQLQELTWKIDWLAFFTLQFKADVKFSNGRNAMSGNGVLSYGFSGIVYSDMHIDMQATELLPYLKLPVPVDLSGKLTLVIEKGTQGAPYCDELDGNLVWHNGQVVTPMGKIDLATPSIDLSCAEGGLVASIKQHSEQITTNAKILLTEGGSYQIDGDIIGREKLEPTILQSISWLGPKTEAGETVLSFKGRL